MNESQIEQKLSTRRGVLGLAAAALAGAVGGALGRPAGAGAGDGDALLVGGDNVGGSASTRLNTTAAIPSGAALSVTGLNAQSGVKAVGKDIGVHGAAPIGVYGDGAVGGVFTGTDAAISLTPAGTPGSPSGHAVKGDLMVDSAGVLHLCVASGTPGTWIPVSHGGIRPLSAPQRAYDSRNAPGGAFAGGETRVIPITAANVGVPANARAIVGNLTITNPSDFGFLSAYPAGTSRPTASSLNWNAAGQTVANAATVALGAGGQIEIYVERAATHVIVDVSAYVL
jgi:hypothetical protein